MLISYYFLQIGLLYFTFINLLSFNDPLCFSQYFSQILSNFGFKLYSQNFQILINLQCRFLQYVIFNLSYTFLIISKFTRENFMGSGWVCICSIYQLLTFLQSYSQLQHLPSSWSHTFFLLSDQDLCVSFQISEVYYSEAQIFV